MILKKCNIGYIIEVSFAITSFNKLPLKRKLEIYEGLQEKGEKYLDAIDAVTEPFGNSSKRRQLIEHAREYFAINLSAPPKNQRGGVLLFLQYFQENLKLIEGVPIIELIDVDIIRMMAQ